MKHELLKVVWLENLAVSLPRTTSFLFVCLQNKVHETKSGKIV